MTRVAGIDGCKRGWVIVHAPSHDLASARVAFSDDLKSFFSQHQITFAVIDIPVGFTSGPNDRDVEASMRAALKGKASSVFNTPCRQALFAPSYEKASETNLSVLGKGLSKQTYAIFPKMREIDGLVQDLGQQVVREGHPEVTFSVLNGKPVLAKKKDSQGASERVALLLRNGIPVDQLLSQPRKLGAGQDDVVDAAAMLSTAVRYLKQEHQTFPPNPSRDSAGLEMSVIA